jgi:lysophospholipase L1-like esterase
LIKTIKIFFFGDSICVGQHVSLHKGWVPRISAKLSELSKEYKVQVIVGNASANGRTTRQALEHMPYEIQSQNVDLLIAQFGMNDCNCWHTDRGLPRVSPDAFKANLKEIVTRAFKFGAKQVFLNTNHPTGLDEEVLPFTNITYQQSNEQYNQIIREVASSFDNRVILNDVESAFMEYTKGSRDRLLELLLPSPDLLHPSERGHDLYYNVAYHSIKNVVLELITHDI